MSKKLISALILIGLTVVVLILNRNGLTVNVIFTKISAAASFVYLGFVTVGVLIGMLLK